MPKNKLDHEANENRLENLLRTIAAKNNPLYSRNVTNHKVGSQVEMVNTDVLPTEINYPPGMDGKTKLEELGCEFIGEVFNDPLFQYVRLPKTWRMVPTTDPSWTHIVDEAGRVTIRIFYRNSLCDRDAFMNVNLYLF